MKTILNTILEHKLAEIATRKQTRSAAELVKHPLFSRSVISLKEKLNREGTGIIAEMKRKSPSAGTILPTLAPSKQAAAYAEQGACGISVLTDQAFFGGSLEDLLTVRQTVDLPILQKDFILDEYQLFEAKAYGADVILLIAAALTKEHCLHLSIIAKSLGLEVILEIHAPHEITYINDEIDFIMVNNRDLHRQVTDVQHSEKLFPLLPENLMKISASGIQTIEEVQYLNQLGYNAVLIGESILKQAHLATLTNSHPL